MLQPPPGHAALAARAAARKNRQDSPFLVSRPDERYQPFPLSDMQQAYWIGRSADLQGGGVAMQSCVELDCPALDTGRFEQALTALVERHDMLHAVVTEDGRQRVLPLPVHFPLTIRDLSALAPEEQERQIAMHAARMETWVSDLSRWPQSEVHFFLLGRNQDGTCRGVLHFRWDMWATDGRSFQILYEDLAALYLDPQAQLPPLPVTFRDYMLALQAHESSPAFQRSLRYWLKELPALPPAPVFPAVQDNGGTTGTAVKRYTAVISREETDFLVRHCAGHGLSLTALLAALYSEVTGLWSASPAFTLNMPRFNRNLHWHASLNHVMGEFATFTLVPVNLRDGNCLLERARALQKTLWNCLEHADVSGVRLLRELARSRGGLAADAMPVIFTAMPARKSSDKGVEQVLRAFGTVRATHGSTPQTTLDCQYTLFNDCLHLYWDARLSAFPPGMTDAMFAEFVRIVRCAATDAAAWTVPHLAALPEDQARVRRLRNNRPLALPDETVCMSFVRRAMADPHAPLLYDDQLCLSCGQVLTHALAVRRAVLDSISTHRVSQGHSAASSAAAGTAGAEHGDVAPLSVALLMERGWKSIVCILGIQLAGLAYLPLDCTNPGPRLHHMLRSGRACAVISEEDVRQRLDPATLARDGIVHLHAERICPAAALHCDSFAASLPAELAATAAKRTDPAYILLTSGTTGTPKAVVVSQDNVLNLCTATNATFAMTAKDRILAVTALHHDLSVYDIFAALSTGAGLVLLPGEQARDPDTWIECMLRHRVSFWNSVPAFLKLLAQRCEEKGVRLPVRIFTAGGDWVEAALPARLRAIAPDAAFYSIGGPTETTVWNIMYKVEDKLPQGWSVIPYGAATENNSYYLLDDELREVPDWVTGEMYCAGANVCLDILSDKPEQRFAVHPQTGERLYRTGDVGRFHPDGLIEILGRTDFQINIGGYRLDPAEIETTLLRHPAVERAIVVPAGQRSGHSGHVLAVFILPAPQHAAPGSGALEADAATSGTPKAGVLNADALEVELTAWLKEHLPVQMLPRLWCFTDTLPLTANGKVDRKALAAELAHRQSLVVQESTDKGPQTPLERLLCELWQEVLGSPVPGVQANFFRLGGDSLKAVQILTRLKEKLPVPLSLAAFFATPTVEGLAQTIIARISAVTSRACGEN